MRITQHFKERLRERTDYNNVENFYSDIENKIDNILKVRKNSKELRYYPHLRNKFDYYPNSTILIIDWMGIGLVTDNNCMITILKL